MKNRKESLTNAAGEVRELLAADFAQAQSFDQLPQALQQQLSGLKKRGRPKLEAPKKMKSFKLSPDVIDAITASGKGYNARVEAVLRAAFTVQ